MNKPHIYVVYRGDIPIATGTAYQIAKKLGVKHETVTWWASPAARRRAEGRGMRYAIRVEADGR